MPPRPMTCALWRCAISTLPAPIRPGAPASRRRPPPISSRSPARRRWASASAITVYGTDYPTPDGTCVRDYIHVADLVAAHAEALAHLRGGGDSLVANCGYGRGYSVLEVIDTVKAVSERDFPVVLGPRRPGDPATIVASPARIMETLGWTPQHDNLAEIVRHALAWEAALERRNRRD